MLGTYKDEAPDVGAYFAEDVRQYIERTTEVTSSTRAGSRSWTTLDLTMQES